MPNPRHVAFPLVLLLAAAPLLAAGPEEGNADGRLTVAGKTTRLAHAWARAEKDAADPRGERVLVVLSDAPLPPEEFLQQFPGQALAEQGKAHVVNVRLKAGSPEVSGAVLHEAFAAADAFCGGGAPSFKAKALDANSAEGVLAMPPSTDCQEKRVEYSATFRAPVWRRPAPTHTGAAAAASAPGKAALAFLRAVSAKDKASLKKALAPGTQAAKALDGPQANDVLEMFRSINPAPGAATIENVLVLGSAAEVTVTGPKGADDSPSHTMLLALVGGDWRLAQEMADSWF